MSTKTWIRHTVWMALLVMGIFIAAQVEARGGRGGGGGGRGGGGGGRSFSGGGGSRGGGGGGIAPGVAQRVRARSVAIVRAVQIILVVAPPAVAVGKGALRKGNKSARVYQSNVGPIDPKCNRVGKGLPVRGKALRPKISRTVKPLPVRGKAPRPKISRPAKPLPAIGNPPVIPSKIETGKTGRITGIMRARTDRNTGRTAREDWQEYGEDYHGEWGGGYHYGDRGGGSASRHGDRVRDDCRRLQRPVEFVYFSVCKRHDLPAMRVNLVSTFLQWRQCDLCRGQSTPVRQ